jgi:hypothetical protein
VVIPGAIYNLRLQAKNVYGWGAFSPISTIAASGIPAQMSTPTTSNVGANV